MRGRDLARMVRDAIDAIGGISSVVRPGQRVFIKTNCLAAGMVDYCPMRAGICTKPEIVVAVAEQCLRAEAAEVTIGDAAQVDRFAWSALRTLDGATNMRDEARRLNAEYGDRVRLACLHADSPAWDAVSSPLSGLETIRVSSLVTRADCVISVPVIKTHVFTQVTGSLKNFVGVTSMYDHGHGLPFRADLHAAPGGLDQVVVDIAAAVKPDLLVIDASICAEGDGPFVVPGLWARTVDVADRLGNWLVLASRDPVAADATAARIISHDPFDVHHLRRAHEQGLGQAERDLIDIVGDNLESMRMPWQSAAHWQPR